MLLIQPSSDADLPPSSHLRQLFADPQPALSPTAEDKAVEHFHTDGSEGEGCSDNADPSNSSPRSDDDDDHSNHDDGVMVREDSTYYVDDEEDEHDDDGGLGTRQESVDCSRFSYERIDRLQTQPHQPTPQTISHIQPAETHSALVAKQRAEIDQASRAQLASWVEDLSAKRDRVDSRVKACSLLGFAAQYELKRYLDQEAAALQAPEGPERAVRLESIRAHIRDTKVSYKALITEAKTVIGSRIPQVVYNREELLALGDGDFNRAVTTIHRNEQLQRGIPECELEPFCASSAATGKTDNPSVLLSSFDRELVRKELASLASQSISMHAAVAPYTIGILVPTLASQGLTVSAESDDPSSPFCYELSPSHRTFFRSRKWIENGETQKHIILSFAAVSQLAQARQTKQAKRKAETLAAANAQLAAWKAAQQSSHM